MKSATGLNVLLLILLAVLVLLNWSLAGDAGRRNVEFLPEMVYAVPAESYASSPVLAGGLVLQPPPAGTIPRGLEPLGFAATEEDALRAGAELTNPLLMGDPAAATPSDTVRGADLFSRYCALCHGGGGEGDGPVAQRGFPAPPSLLAPHAREMADGQIFHVITYGQGNMPGHAAQLDREDRWRATLRVRELQAAAAPDPLSAVDAAAAAAADSADSEGAVADAPASGDEAGEAPAVEPTATADASGPSAQEEEPS